MFFNFIVPFIAALFVVILFSRINFKNIKVGKIITFISTGVLPIYLIHDNPTFRQFFWEYFIRETVLEKWIGVSTVEGSGWFALLSIGAIAAVFIGCAIVEFIRTYVIEKIYIKNIKSLGKRVDDKVDRYIKKDTESQAQQ